MDPRLRLEVTVTETQSAPEKALLSISTGSIRRQTGLELKKPFHVPHNGSPGQLQVNLLEPLGSKALGVEELLKNSGTDQIYSVPVSKRDGSQTEVKLQVRPIDANAPIKAPQGGDTGKTDREYLDVHRLQERVQMLLQEVLKSRPDDPYTFMVNTLSTLKSQKCSEPAAAAPATAAPAAASGACTAAEAAAAMPVVVFSVLKAYSLKEAPVQEQVAVAIRTSLTNVTAQLAASAVAAVCQ